MFCKSYCNWNKLTYKIRKSNNIISFCQFLSGFEWVLNMDILAKYFVIDANEFCKKMTTIFDCDLPFTLGPRISLVIFLLFYHASFSSNFITFLETFKRNCETIVLIIVKSMLISFFKWFLFHKLLFRTWFFICTG